MSEGLCDYYREKTAGGYFGLVITEHSYINKEGQASVGQVSVSRDADIEGLKRLVEVVHVSGSKVIPQINHAGGKAICALDYPEMAAAIVGQYLTDYSQEFLQEAAKATYGVAFGGKAAIWPLFRMRCTLWNCGTARPAPSRITPCS